MSEGNGTVPVTGIKISPSAMSLWVGETQKLTATVTPSNATDKRVAWSTSNGNVTVDDNGNITAVQPGSCDIFATARDGSGVSAKLTMSVSGTYVAGNSGKNNRGKTLAKQKGFYEDKPAEKVVYSYKMKRARTRNKVTLFDPGAKISVPPHQASIPLCDNAWTAQFVAYGIFEWLE